MSAPDEPRSAPPDEFDTIERLFRPLAPCPEARGLADDVAVLPSRPGHDLILTKDAIVEGVHFLPDDAPELVARKLLRVNLSDLAAKGAEPFGYLLAVAWSPRWGWREREAFAAGLAQDQSIFGVVLLGGDTVSTPGPFTASVTALGYAPAGRTVPRSGARPGDRVLVSGAIGDGWLGLAAARGSLDLPPAAVAYLADRYRLPRPRVDLAPAVLDAASASADVSDGLLADAGHIAKASGVALSLELGAMPISDEARAWMAGQSDEAEALVALASGGDDYQIVCTAPPADAERLRSHGFADIGVVEEGTGVSVAFAGRRVVASRSGWRHV
jgi:thiamine-monophosphate kinase